MFLLNECVLEKVKFIVCDGLIFDLEDVVVFDVKVDVWFVVCVVVVLGDYGFCEVMICVNGVDMEWYFDDLCVVCEVGLDVIVVFKVNLVDVVF